MRDPSSNGEPQHPHGQVLGMAVHALPAATPQALDALARERQDRHARWKMLGILLVCAAPVLASYITYFVIRPLERGIHGRLIEPPRAMPDMLRPLAGQWLLVSVSVGACQAQCQNNLYFQRQLHDALGADGLRLDWAWLITDEQPIEARWQAALQEPGAQALRVPGQELTPWLEPAPHHRLPDHLYLLDPDGNWVMRLPPGIDLENAADIRQDLARLIQAEPAARRPGRATDIAE